MGHGTSLFFSRALENMLLIAEIYFHSKIECDNYAELRARISITLKLQTIDTEWNRVRQREGEEERRLNAKQG